MILLDTLVSPLSEQVAEGEQTAARSRGRQVRSADPLCNIELPCADKRFVGARYPVCSIDGIGRIALVVLFSFEAV